MIKHYNNPIDDPLLQEVLKINPFKNLDCIWKGIESWPEITKDYIVSGLSNNHSILLFATADFIFLCNSTNFEFPVLTSMK